jgi:hypothetical protein
MGEIERPAAKPAFLAMSGSDRPPFTPHSQNKVSGTGGTAEHRGSPFVVGVGNANT